MCKDGIAIALFTYTYAYCIEYLLYTGQKLIVNSLDGKYILINEVINDYKMRARLTILNLQKEDFTEYNVTARNAMGEETGVIKLHSK